MDAIVIVGVLFTFWFPIWVGYSVGGNIGAAIGGAISLYALGAYLHGPEWPIDMVMGR